MGGFENTMAINSISGNSINPYYYSPWESIHTQKRGNNNIAKEDSDTVQHDNKLKSPVPSQNLDETEKKKVEELKAIDAKVKAHEMSHIAAGGRFVKGGTRFHYQKGPDGSLYATGGEVSIDTSEVPGNPEATANKMQTVRRAALAPASPSSQDVAVAVKAAQKEAQAFMKASRMKMEKNESRDNNVKGNSKISVAERHYSAGQDSGTGVNIDMEI